jgi:hypothetical protein
VVAARPRVRFGPLLQGLLAAVSKADLVATNLVAHRGEDQMKFCDPTHLLTRRATLGYLLPRQGLDSCEPCLHKAIPKLVNRVSCVTHGLFLSLCSTP